MRFQTWNTHAFMAWDMVLFLWWSLAIDKLRNLKSVKIFCDKYSHPQGFEN